MEGLLMFLGGLALGVALAIVVMVSVVKVASSEAKKMQKEAENDDPANWWRRGDGQ